MRQDKSLCLLCLTSKGKSWVPWELLRFSSACNKCKKKSLFRDWTSTHAPNCCWMRINKVNVHNTGEMSVSITRIAGMPCAYYVRVLLRYWGTLEYLILRSIFLLPHFLFPLPMSSSSGWKMLVFSTASLCCPESSKEDERKERGWATLCIKLSTSPIYLLQGPLSGWEWWPVTSKIKAVDWSFMKRNVNKVVVWNYLL